MLKHNKYKCDDGGVKIPCPWCDTYKFIKYRSYIALKNYVRCIAGYKETIPIVFFEYCCTNKDCCGDPSKNKTGENVAACSDHYFNLTFS